MIKDPVCGMKITGETAPAKSIYKGMTFYFCSAFCKQMFDRDPEKYIKALENQT
jgi:YHS domain-containing protein